MKESPLSDVKRVLTWAVGKGEHECVGLQAKGAGMGSWADRLQKEVFRHRMSKRCFWCLVCQ